PYPSASGATNRVRADRPASPAPSVDDVEIAFALADEGPPLALVQAAPHPVGLPDADRVLEALDADGTDPADRLGLAFPRQAFGLRFEAARGEEEAGVLAAARRPPLPSP